MARQNTAERNTRATDSQKWRMSGTVCRRWDSRYILAGRYYFGCARVAIARICDSNVCPSRGCRLLVLAGPGVLPRITLRRERSEGSEGPILAKEKRNRRVVPKTSGDHAFSLSLSTLVCFSRCSPLARCVNST